MSVIIGIVLAFAAMLCWGFGDFFIQKSTRKLGDWEALFLVTLFGAIILTPFVYQDLSSIFQLNTEFFILLAASLILFIAALLDFEALKRGKLSIIEPVWSFEIPISALLAFFIMSEKISVYQIVLIVTLVLGLVLVSLKSEHFNKKAWLEKGVLIAFLAAIIMGAANFFVGWGARETSALVINWFFNIFIALACFFYIIFNRSPQALFQDIKRNKGILIGMCFLDNIAWVAFAFSMVLAPIAVAVALSESYIVIAVLLGMYVNREFIRKHQKLGIAIAVISAIILAYITI